MADPSSDPSADRARSTQRAYDSAAADFAERTVQRSDMAAAFFDRFETALGRGSCIADLGCGPGHDAGRLTAAGHRVVGVDRSVGLLSCCPSEIAGVQGDLRSIPLAADSVDAIWCSAALLHIDRDDISATFMEWNRILRADGIIGFASSLADSASTQHEGWELVPAAGHRVAQVDPGTQRWFVHHHEDSLRAAAQAAGWIVDWSKIRESHRNWLQLLAHR